MIKKILLGLGITFLSFIGFSSAEWVVRDNGVYGYSTLDNNIDLNVVNKGQLMSQKFGNTKRMLAFSSKLNSSNSQNERIFFFWSNLQKPYYFVNYAGKFYQGYVKTYYLCPLYFSGLNSSFDGCNKYNITDNFAVEVGGLFDSITINDTWGYDIHTWNCYGTTQLINRVCFSSSSSNYSICFSAGAGSSNGCACYDCGNTENSLGIFSGVDFTQVSDSILSTPPGFQSSGGGNIEGSSSVGTNTTVTGNVMLSPCTNGYIVSEISNLYGGINNICYAGTNNTGIINDFVARTPMLQGLNFKEVYNGSLNVTINGATPYYSNYLDWFNTWMTAMQKYKLGQISFDVFNGQPVYLYAYFDRLYQNGVIPGQTDAYNIANICKLALFSDYSQEYKGTQFKEACNKLNYNPGNSGIVTTGEVGSIDNDNQEILPLGTDIGGGNSNTSSGTIISVDWSGTLSGDTNKNFDGKTFINDFYQKLQANFQKPTNDLTGIVPVYIYVFLIALVLFRFLSH